MEAKARSSVEAVKDSQNELRPRFIRVWVWTLTVALLAGVLVIAPNWRTTVATVLALGAYHVWRRRLWTVEGPCGGFVGGAFVARNFFILDSKGRTRVWLGVENEYGDEEGPRLVMYNENGQARLALRLVRENIEQGPNVEGRHAEVVENENTVIKQSDVTDPALVMFGQDGKIKLALWENGDCPSVDVEGENGKAGVAPNQVWVMGKNFQSKSMEAG
jgi:hypothetical protein